MESQRIVTAFPRHCLSLDSTIFSGELRRLLQWKGLKRIFKVVVDGSLTLNRMSFLPFLHSTLSQHLLEGHPYTCMFSYGNLREVVL